MSNFDDLLQEQEHATVQSDQPFDRDAWKQQKQEQRETVYAMIEETTGAVAQDGNAFQKYLDVQSRFNRYSVSNALLILNQKPDATALKDFETWKEQGVYIRKSETGIYILEPGEEYKREDGTTGFSYKPKKVFDVSQTGGSHRPEAKSYPDDRVRIKALMDHAPVAVRISETLPDGVNALYQANKREILARRGMSAGDIFRSLTQEMAHSEMDKGDRNYGRSENGFKAYCVSYMLCKQYGVETEGYFHFEGAPQILSGMEPQQIRSELSDIKEAAGEISGRMNRMLAQQREQKQKEAER